MVSTSHRITDVPTSPIARLFAVIDLTAKMGTISVADAVYLLDLPRPTAHRMITTLQGLGFLQKLPLKGKYALAPKLIRLTSSILASTIVYAPLQALLRAVAEKTGETCAVALPAASEVEYIASVMGPSPLTLQFQEGQKAPLYCTSSGHVFLAALPTETLDAYLETGPWEQLTPSTVTTPKALRVQLQQVRSQGWAANASAYITGVVGAAVPIEDADRRVIASLTVSAPMSRHTLADIVAMVPTLRHYAQRIRYILQPR